VTVVEYQSLVLWAAVLISDRLADVSYVGFVLVVDFPGPDVVLESCSK